MRRVLLDTNVVLDAPPERVPWVAARLDAIVTRDPASFRASPIPVLTPTQWLDQRTPPPPGTV